MVTWELKQEIYRIFPKSSSNTYVKARALFAQNMSESGHRDLYKSQDGKAKMAEHCDEI